MIGRGTFRLDASYWTLGAAAIDVEDEVTVEIGSTVIFRGYVYSVSPFGGQYKGSDIEVTVVDKMWRLYLTTCLDLGSSATDVDGYVEDLIEHAVGSGQLIADTDSRGLDPVLVAAGARESVRDVLTRVLKAYGGRVWYNSQTDKFIFESWANRFPTLGAAVLAYSDQPAIELRATDDTRWMVRSADLTIRYATIGNGGNRKQIADGAGLRVPPGQSTRWIKYFDDSDVVSAYDFAAFNAGVGGYIIKDEANTTFWTDAPASVTVTATFGPGEARLDIDNTNAGWGFFEELRIDAKFVQRNRRVSVYAENTSDLGEVYSVEADAFGESQEEDAAFDLVSDIVEHWGILPPKFCEYIKFDAGQIIVAKDPRTLLPTDQVSIAANRTNISPTSHHVMRIEMSEEVTTVYFEPRPYSEPSPPV